MRIHQLVLLLVSASAAAQEPDSTLQSRGATVSGVVHDSVSQSPLAGAIVQLVSPDGSTGFARTTVSDSLGRFTLRGVTEGRFTIGFLHPMLDSLGLDSPLREVSVRGRAPLRLDLAIPSPARIRSVICASPSRGDSSGVVIGFLRDAHTQAPLAGANVNSEWLEITFGPKGLSRRIPHLTTTTGPTGWFALCEVPNTGALVLSANRGADSTDLIELPIPANGFLRHDLYLEVSPPNASPDPAKRTDVNAPIRVTRSSEGRVSGIVVTAVGAKPIASAAVSIPSGPSTRTNERGEWTLAGAQFGTRVLEVHAVGFYPVRRPVNIIDGSPPVRIALSTFQAVLDTVRVQAKAPGFDQNAFLQRRRSSGGGRFLTPEDITRRHPVVTSDLFRTVPGLDVERSASGSTAIKMRGTFEDKCDPAIYIDGAYFSDLSTDDVDDAVHPDEIAGIEVYTGAALPPQFQRALGGCGSIVIWTKRQTRW
jgi:Carboxypeptidase regulatory-like domain/TonB-dependent Receptor Plug Domain